MRLSATNMFCALLFSAALCLCRAGVVQALQLSGLGSVELSSGWSSGSISRTVSFCVYDETGLVSDYILVASSSGGANFELAGPGTLAFDVSWRSSGAWTPLTPGVPQPFSFVPSGQSCSNTSVNFSIGETELSAAKSGSYTGWVRFDLEPQ